MYTPFSFCPRCGKEYRQSLNANYFSCPFCGFEYYQNIAAAAGIIIHDDHSVLVIERNMEPGKGLLGLPGGFIDMNESAEEGALRECLEETGILLNYNDLTYLTSKPNIYTYKNISYHTCDIIFKAYVRKLPLSVIPKDNEAARIYAIPFDGINVEQFAFPSLQKAVGFWLESTKKPGGAPPG